jgi:hypothetical protein
MQVQYGRVNCWIRACVSMCAVQTLFRSRSSLAEAMRGHQNFMSLQPPADPGVYSFCL